MLLVISRFNVNKYSHISLRKLCYILKIYSICVQLGGTFIKIINFNPMRFQTLFSR